MSGLSTASEESISLLKVEMVVLEINFGKGRKDDILVHFGDNPMDLAEQFVAKHSLKDSAVAAICATLEQTIADFKEENDPATFFDAPLSTASSEAKVGDFQLYADNKKVIGKFNDVEMPEDYKGQPPVELQVNGLPEPYRPDTADENIRIINGIVVQFPVTPTTPPSAASTRYGSIVSYDSGFLYPISPPPESISLDPNTNTITANSNNNNNSNSSNSPNRAKDDIDYLRSSSVAKAFSSTSTSVNPKSAGRSNGPSNHDSFYLSKSADATDDMTFELNDFRTPLVPSLSPNSRPESIKVLSLSPTNIPVPITATAAVPSPPSAPVSTSSSSSRFFGGSISDKIAASKLPHKGQDRLVSPGGIKSVHSPTRSTDMTRDTQRDKDKDKDKEKEQLVKFVPSDIILSYTKKELSVSTFNDEIPSSSIIVTGRISPSNFNSVMVGRSGEMQKLVPRLQHKALSPVGGSVRVSPSGSAGHSSKSITPPRTISPKVSSKRISRSNSTSSSPPKSGRGKRRIEIRSLSPREEREREKDRERERERDREKDVDSGKDVVIVRSSPLVDDEIQLDSNSATPLSEAQRQKLADASEKSERSQSQKQGDDEDDDELQELKPKNESEGCYKMMPSELSFKSLSVMCDIEPRRKLHISNTDISDGLSALKKVNNFQYMSEGTDESRSRSTTQSSVMKGGVKNINEINFTGQKESREEGSRPYVTPVHPSDNWEKSSVEDKDKTVGQVQSILDSNTDNDDDDYASISPQVSFDQQSSSNYREVEGSMRGRSETIESTFGPSEEEKSYYALKSLNGRNESLIPTASILALNKEFRPETNLAGINSRKLTPNSKKTVGERLHDSGNKSRVLRERRVLLADEDKMKKIASAQFTVKGLSKGMINTKSNLDVCSRLYSDGLKEIERKKNRAKDKRVEWSCSRCGVFQSSSSSSSSPGPGSSSYTGSEQSQSQGVGGGGGGSGSVGSLKDQVCCNCGYNQSSSIPFRPTNHSLYSQYDQHNGDNNGNSNYDEYDRGGENDSGGRSSYLNQIPGQGPGSGRGYDSINGSMHSTSYYNNRPSVFDSLYANVQHETAMRRARDICRMNNAVEFTFQPAISDGSNQILQRRIDETRERERDIDGDRDREDLRNGFYHREQEGPSYEMTSENAFPLRRSSVSEDAGYPGNRPRDRSRTRSGGPQNNNSNNRGRSQEGRNCCSSSFARPTKSILYDREREKEKERASSAPNVRDLAHYLTMPAAERLYHDKGTPVRSLSSSNRRHNNNNSSSSYPYDDSMGEEYSRNQGPGSGSHKIISTEQSHSLVDRLTYEYKEKEKRLAKAILEITSKDPKTGNKYFQPVVPPRVFVSPGRRSEGHQSLPQSQSQTQAGSQSEEFRSGGMRGSGSGSLGGGGGREKGSGVRSGGGSDRKSTGRDSAMDRYEVTSSVGIDTFYPYPEATTNTNTTQPSYPVKEIKRTPEMVYRDLIRRDDERQERRRLAQLNAETLIAGQLSVTASNTLPMSEIIMKEANERQVKDLFSMLIANTTPTPSFSPSTISPLHSQRDTDRDGYRDRDRESGSNSKNERIMKSPRDTPSTMHTDNTHHTHTENTTKNDIIDELDCSSEMSHADFNNLSLSAISSPGKKLQHNLTQSQTQSLALALPLTQTQTQIQDQSQYKFLTKANGSQIITSARSGCSWDNVKLDLDRVNLASFAPEVAALVNQVRKERTRRTPVKKQKDNEKDKGTEKGQTRASWEKEKEREKEMSSINGSILSLQELGERERGKSNTPMDFSEFSKLVARCMQRREGQPGRSYLYLPNKVKAPEPPTTLTQRERDSGEYTFRPTIDQNSVTLSMARHNKENVLAVENVPEKEKGRRPSRELHHYHTQTQAAMQSASDSGKGRLTMIGVPLAEFLNDDSFSTTLRASLTEKGGSLDVSRGGSGSFPVSTSTSMSMSKRISSSPRRHTPIENILLDAGHKAAVRVEAARKDQLKSESEIYTFKPTLFKPPRHLVPRYKGDRERVKPPPPPDDDEDHVQLESDRQRHAQQRQIDQDESPSSVPLLDESEELNRSYSTEFSELSGPVRRLEGGTMQLSNLIHSSSDGNGDTENKSELGSPFCNSLSNFYDSALSSDIVGDGWRREASIRENMRARAGTDEGDNHYQSENTEMKRSFKEGDERRSADNLQQLQQKEQQQQQQPQHEEIRIQVKRVPSQYKLEEDRTNNIPGPPYVPRDTCGGGQVKIQVHSDERKSSSGSGGGVGNSSASSSGSMSMVVSGPSVEATPRLSTVLSSPLPSPYTGSKTPIGIGINTSSVISDVRNLDPTPNLHLNRNLFVDGEINDISNRSNNTILGGSGSTLNSPPYEQNVRTVPDRVPDNEMRPQWDGRKKVIYDDVNIGGAAYRPVAPRAKGRARASTGTLNGTKGGVRTSQDDFQYLDSNLQEHPRSDRGSNVDKNRSMHHPFANERGQSLGQSQDRGERVGARMDSRGSSDGSGSYAASATATRGNRGYRPVPVFVPPPLPMELQRRKQAEMH